MAFTDLRIDPSICSNVKDSAGVGAFWLAKIVKDFKIHIFTILLVATRQQTVPICLFILLNQLKLDFKFKSTYIRSFVIFGEHKNKIRYCEHSNEILFSAVP